MAVAGSISGLFGGAVAQWLGSGWRVTVCGWPLTYHGVLFFCSTALRVGAIAWIFTLQETRGLVATRDALRYIAADAYSNLLQATFFPIRVLTSLARASWKVPWKRR